MHPGLTSAQIFSRIQNQTSAESFQRIPYPVPFFYFLHKHQESFLCLCFLSRKQGTSQLYTSGRCKNLYPKTKTKKKRCCHHPNPACPVSGRKYPIFFMSIYDSVTHDPHLVKGYDDTAVNYTNGA